MEYFFDANMNGTFDSMSITMLAANGFSNVWGEMLQNGGELGVHWTMSCANDVSEGAIVTTVPVPAAAYLFGTGLFGLLAVARRKV